MKKRIVLFVTWFMFLLIPICAQGTDGKSKLEIKYHRKALNKGESIRDRSLFHLPINAYYDADIRRVEVTCAYELSAEVFLYNEDGDLLQAAPTLNTYIYVPENVGDMVILRIESDDWYAVGYVQLENVDE